MKSHDASNITYATMEGSFRLQAMDIDQVTHKNVEMNIRIYTQTVIIPYTYVRKFHVILCCDIHCCVQ